MAQNVRLEADAHRYEPHAGEHTADSVKVLKRHQDVTRDLIMETVVTKFQWGGATGNYGQLIFLHIRGFEKPVVLDFEEEIVLGRQPTNRDGQPMVDLTPYDGSEKGVSRIHAAIQRIRHNIVLVDLGSSNKSFINGQRLPSNQPHVLVEGDEIRLGNLIARISYGPRQTPKP